MTHLPDAAPAVLHIRSLGIQSIDLLRGDEKLGSMGTGKPLALLAYLASAPGRSESRDRLLDLLWSDVELDAGRHALRQTLWYMKRRLGEAVVSTHGDRLTLHCPTDFDRDRFLLAAERADWAGAAAGYPGPFFDGFAVPGGDEFERWVDFERHRLESILTRCLERLVAEHLATGHAREAQAHARRLRDMAPLRQSSWRLLLETHVAASDAVATVTECDALEAMLAHEGIEAEPATLRAIRGARQVKVSPVTPAFRHLAAELVGRESEFATLLASWDRAREGQSTSVLVVAEAGVGKTRLLKELEARLRASRARIVAVRATHATSGIPYALCSDLVGALAAMPGALGVSNVSASSLVAINPAVSSTFRGARAEVQGPDDVARHRLLAVRELVVAVADEQPVAVLVDDMHWCDGASRQLVAALMAGLDRSRVLFAVTSRPPITSSDLGAPTVLTLTPFHREHVGRLLASIAMLPTDAWATQLIDGAYAAAGGNPLLLLETLKLAIDHGALRIAEGHWVLADRDALQDLLGDGAALRRRLDDVIDADRRLLLTLAVSGVALSTEELGAALPEGTDVAGGLSRLAATGLVTLQLDRWRVVHDAYVPLVLGDATTAQLTEVHRAIGIALMRGADRDVQAERRATAHFVAANDIPDLAELATRRVARARRQDDGRSARRLVQELIGDAGDDALVDDVLSRLPMRLRASSSGSVRMATYAVGVVALLLSGILIGSTLRGGAVETTEIGVATEGTAGVEVTLFRLRMDDGSARLENTQRLPLPGAGNALRANFADAAALPDGWIVSLPRDDGRGADLWRINDRGQRHRLTFSTADDHNPSASPDGRYVSFSTGQFDTTLFHDDVAVLELETGRIRPLAARPGWQNGGKWSPDGARIAFMDRPPEAARSRLCIVDFDGARERCHADVEIEYIAGWIDARTLLLGVVDSARTPRIVYYYAASGERKATPLRAHTARLSPDGSMLLCTCTGRDDPLRWQWFALTDLEHPRPLPIDTRRLAGTIFWGRPESRRRGVDRLELLPASRPLPVARARLLDVRALDPSNAEISVSDVRWQVSDTTIATIDETGELVGMREGVVEVTANLGGWRAMRARYEIGPSAAFRPITNESWDSTWTTRWFRFGEPLPTVTLIDGVSWMLPNGDGDYASGVFGRQKWKIEAGLRLRTSVRMPITRGQWQQQSIGFGGMADSVAPAELASRPSPPDAIPWTCQFGYPADPEGPGRGKVFGVAAGNHARAELYPAPAAWRSGQPFAVTVELLDDGRCRVSAEGVAPVITRDRVDTAYNYVLVAVNQSKGTRLAVGPITVERLTVTGPPGR